MAKVGETIREKFLRLERERWAICPACSEGVRPVPKAATAGTEGAYHAKCYEHER